MDIGKNIMGRVAVLELRGAIVEDEAAKIDHAVGECLALGINRIVFDFGSVAFIDSAGLEHLLKNVSSLSKTGGNVRISGLNEICRDIFTATRMSSYVIVNDTTANAVQSVI
jgi:anti-anti-sigma factor